MNNKTLIQLTSSLVLLVILLFNNFSFAQKPILFQKFLNYQIKVQSGYVKTKCIYMTDSDTTASHIEYAYFINTPKDLKYFVIKATSVDVDYFCKSGNTVLMFFNRIQNPRYRCYEQTCDPKVDDAYNFDYPDFIYSYNKNYEKDTFVRITPKVNKNNIRYKIISPDDDMNSNIVQEWEFDKNSLNWVQAESGSTLYNTERFYGSIEILESQFYDYIHPDILDTITFRYEELRKNSDLQKKKEQNLKDSILKVNLLDSIMQFSVLKENPLINSITTNDVKDSFKFMPSWKLPLLSGDTLNSDSIQSRYLFIDMWYIGCFPCRVAMKELGTIDTIFDKSLIKFVSINVADNDSAKIMLIVNNVGFNSEIVYTYNTRIDTLLSKEMGDCYGYPQLYLVDLKTKQVVWRSCGYYQGFTKQLEAILRKTELE